MTPIRLRRPARPANRVLPSPGRRRAVLAGGAALLLAAGAPARAAVPAAVPSALAFDGVDYRHRWSRDGQHEFTPAGDDDLTAWRDMLTVNVHADTRDAGALAALAEAVAARYRRHGRVLAARAAASAAPGAATPPAEYLLVALFERPAFVEAAFARLVLGASGGVVVVRSRRAYGPDAAVAMARWLAEHGRRVEQSLRAWSGWTLAAVPARRLGA